MADDARTDADEVARSPETPRWPWAVGLALCAGGFAVAGYLTYEHYTASTSLSCPAGGGIVNCFKVTTSTYSKIGGVPVAVLGLVFFTLMAVLQSPPAWRSDRTGLRAARLGWALTGVATAVWLIYAELFKLDAICLWCSAEHAISLALFALTAFATAVTAADDSADSAVSASGDRAAVGKGLDPA